MFSRQGPNKHGGNLRELAELSGRDISEILDFSANINPLGFPENLRMILSANTSSLIHYPDIGYHALKEKISEFYDVDRDAIVLGNGSTEILYTLPIALNINHAILPIPAYADYQKVLENHQISYQYFPFL